MTTLPIIALSMPIPIRTPAIASGMAFSAHKTKAASATVPPPRKRLNSFELGFILALNRFQMRQAPACLEIM